MVFAAHRSCGSAMGSTPTYFFVQVGLLNSVSFKISIGELGLASVGTNASWFLMSYCSRQTIYLWGLGGLIAILMTVGAISAGDNVRRRTTMLRLAC